MPDKSTNNHNLSTQIYNNLKRDLMYLKILPGSILQEREISNKYSVSRTPTREAIQKLAHEGWISIHPRRNILVRNISKKDVIEIFQIRNIIEPMATDIIIKERIADMAFIKSIQKILYDMDFAKNNTEKFINLDQEFHCEIIHKIGNRRLSTIWKILKDEIIRLGIMAMQKPGRLENVIQEHKKIVIALVNMERLEAKKSCMTHLCSTERVILDSIFDKGEIS